jgi:uncharacterized protein YxjI
MSNALVPFATQYVAKKALFSFMGNTFRIYGSDGSLQFFIKQKAFRLKEEINVFGDEGQKQKRLVIKARGIGDFAGTYDVKDANTGENVGACRRKGLKSLFKDEWEILDAGGSPVGKVEEEGGLMFILHKFIKLIPQRYRVVVGGQEVGTIHQRFNLFGLSYDVDFSKGVGSLDPRLGVAMTVLLLAIEGRAD